MRISRILLSGGLLALAAQSAGAQSPDSARIEADRRASYVQGSITTTANKLDTALVRLARGDTVGVAAELRQALGRVRATRTHVLVLRGLLALEYADTPAVEPPPPVVEVAKPDPPPVPSGYAVPASIAADCSVDVTDALSAWIASVPDSSTLRLGKNACYNVDRGLKVYDRHGLTFEGNGATLRRVSRGVTQQSNLHFAGGGGLTIRNLILRGANPNAGAANELAYVVELENQHGIYLAGIQGAVIEDVQIYDVFGDFIAMTHDYRLPAAAFPGVPNRDVVIRRGHFERNGRMGVAVTHGERITLEDSYVGDVRWSAFDLELDDDREIGRDITIQRNRFGPVQHYAFINAGKGAPESVRNVTIRGNVMAYTPQTCVGVIRIRGKGWSGYTVEGNALTTRGGGIGIEFTSVNNAVARENTITSGSVGGCAQAAPVLVQYSNHVALIGNRLVGPWPETRRVVQTSTNVTEEGTTR